MPDIEELSGTTDVQGLSETWIRGNESDLQNMIDKHRKVQLDENFRRGFGGVALILNHILHFKAYRKRMKQYAQLLTIRTAGIVILVVYISPRASVGEEQDKFQHVKRLSRRPSVIMGDLNARHIAWDTKPDYKGLRLTSWAKTNQWGINSSRAQPFQERVTFVT